jgi:hypothetical protein
MYALQTLITYTSRHRLSAFVLCCYCLLHNDCAQWLRHHNARRWTNTRRQVWIRYSIHQFVNGALQHYWRFLPMCLVISFTIRIYYQRYLQCFSVFLYTIAIGQVALQNYCFVSQSFLQFGVISIWYSGQLSGPITRCFFGLSWYILNYSSTYFLSTLCMHFCMDVYQTGR